MLLLQSLSQLLKLFLSLPICDEYTCEGSCVAMVLVAFGFTVFDSDVCFVLVDRRCHIGGNCGLSSKF